MVDSQQIWVDVMNYSGSCKNIYDMQFPFFFTGACFYMVMGYSMIIYYLHEVCNDQIRVITTYIFPDPSNS